MASRAQATGTATKSGRESTAEATRARDPRDGGTPVPAKMTGAGLRGWDDQEAALQAAGWGKAGGDGTVQGWEEGRWVTGTLLRVKEGKFTPLAVLRKPDNEVVTVAMPAILQDRMMGCVPGDEVFIRCVGIVVTKSGQGAWDFIVYVRPATKATQEALAL